MTIDRKRGAVLAAVAVVLLIGGLVYAAHLGGAGSEVGDPACTGVCTNCPLAGQSACPPATEASAAPRVDQAKCVRCLRCVRVAPEAYEVDPVSQSVRVRPDAPTEAIKRGAAACPVNAVQL